MQAGAKKDRGEDFEKLVLTPNNTKSRGDFFVDANETHLLLPHRGEEDRDRDGEERAEAEGDGGGDVPKFAGCPVVCVSWQIDSRVNLSAVCVFFISSAKWGVGGS